MLLVSAALLALCSWGDGQHINSVAGPFRVIPDQIEYCPLSFFKEGGPQSDWKFRGNRDRTNPDVWYYSGNYSIRFNFTDDLNVIMSMASWSSRGGWKDNAHILKFKRICATGKMYVPTIWHLIMASVKDQNNVTRPDCPFPVGNYTLNNCKADLGIAKKVPGFFYGKWRLDFKIVDSLWECISCMRMYIRTVPLVAHGDQFGANTG